MVKKTKLSQGQQRRVSANQARRLKKEAPEIDESLLTIREIDEEEYAAQNEPDPNAPAPLLLGDDAPEIPPTDFPL